MLEILIARMMAFAVENENSLMDELIRGEWYTAVTEVYVRTMGPAFHVVIFILGPALIGIKYQRFAPVAMIVLGTGVVFSTFFEAQIQFIFAGAAIFGLAGVLYGVVHK